LDTTVRGEEAPAPGVERRIVFEDDNRGFYGVESGTSARQDFEAGLKSGANSGLVSGRLGIGDGPCSAMNEENRGAD